MRGTRRTRRFSWKSHVNWISKPNHVFYNLKKVRNLLIKFQFQKYIPLGIIVFHYQEDWCIKSTFSTIFQHSKYFFIFYHLVLIILFILLVLKNLSTSPSNKFIIKYIFNYYYLFLYSNNFEKEWLTKTKECY